MNPSVTGIESNGGFSIFERISDNKIQRHKRQDVTYEWELPIGDVDYQVERIQVLVQGSLQEKKRMLELRVNAPGDTKFSIYQLGRKHTELIYLIGRKQTKDKNPTWDTFYLTTELKDTFRWAINPYDSLEVCNHIMRVVTEQVGIIKKDK